MPLWINPVFLQSVSELQELEALQLLCHKGEQLVAAMPLYERKSMGMRRLIIPMSAYYQGLWFRWEANRDENRNLLDELKISGEIGKFLRGRYKRIHFNLGTHNYDVRGFDWAGFKARPLYTFVQQLSEPFHPLKDERKKLKTAQQEQLTFEEKFSPEEFVEMLKKLYNRKNKRLGVPYPRFLEWMKNLHEQGLLSQFNLMRDKEIVSANLMLGTSGDETAYSIMRCTTAEGLKQGASSLHSQLLVERLGGRHEFLDFCGANYPEVARFKAALGFRLKLFFQLEA
ncbi:MAG: hypothetical protein K0B87_04445 [Candidatus Syntrophosphaera sp.]|nr:hypothetical protein [Candidatus Syntrophosphaera sp.]